MWLSELCESSNDPLETVVARLKAHPAVAPIFKRGDHEIDLKGCVEAFLSIVGGNHEARKMAKDYAFITVDLYRDPKHRENPEEHFHYLDKGKVPAIVDDIRSFVNAATRYRKGSVPAYLKASVKRFLETNGVYHDISQGDLADLMKIPGIRPDRPTVLYRGLLFTDMNFNKGRFSIAGTQLDVRPMFNALKDGKRTLNFQWDRASSWTTKLHVAERFARYKPAKNNYQAMGAWLNREGHIDGRYGMIVSTLAQPHEIVCEVSRLNFPHLAHGDEAEMILPPGTKLVRVHSLFNKKGPLDLSGLADDPDLQ